jgi:hypothetical protein
MAALRPASDGRSLNLDANTLLAGLLVSSIGFVLLTYGRKASRFPHLCTGLILLVYPYFVPGALLTLGIGALILTLLWIAVRSGL